MSSSVSSSSSVCHLRLLLFGASGRTGQIVLEEALQRGYCVTAFVRNPAKLNGVLAGWSQEKKNRFKLAKGTVVNEVEVEKVIRNGFEDGKPFDAVLSTLTSDEKPHNACSVSTTHVLGAFQKLQDERKSTSDHSSSLSISPFRYLVVGAMFDEEFLNSRSFFESLLLKPALWLFGESAKDRKKEASLLHTAHAANPHWRLLMVAPPLLTNGALTKNYSVDSKNPGMKIWSTVSRSDVAHYMLRLVEEDDAHVKVHTKGIYAPLYDA